MVQTGVNPFHPAAAAFPQPAHTAESLSAAVAAKSEQIAAAHKQDASGGGGAPNQIPGSQVCKCEHFLMPLFLFVLFLCSSYWECIIHMKTAWY